MATGRGHAADQQDLVDLHEALGELQGLVRVEVVVVVDELGRPDAQGRRQLLPEVLDPRLAAAQAGLAVDGERPRQDRRAADAPAVAEHALVRVVVGARRAPAGCGGGTAAGASGPPAHRWSAGALGSAAPAPPSPVPRRRAAPVAWRRPRPALVAAPVALAAAAPRRRRPAVAAVVTGGDELGFTVVGADDGQRRERRHEHRHRGDRGDRVEGALEGLVHAPTSWAARNTERKRSLRSSSSPDDPSKRTCPFSMKYA